MGLEISKNSKVIHIKGMDIELQSVYGRASLICLQDGVTINVTIKTYMDYYSYKNASELTTDINQLSFDFVILKTETQSVQVGLEYAKNRFIELGYNCEIN